MGRKAKPLALKLTDGNPGKRPLDYAEPTPEKGTPDCPDTVNDNEDARDFWNRLSTVLDQMGLSTKADWAIMEMASLDWALLKKAEREIASGGEVIETLHGNMIQNPWLGIANQCKIRMAKNMTELALTPAARAGLKVAPRAKPRDAVKDFIAAKGAIKTA